MRLRVNGPVPGRKPKRNPWTVSGFPRWNTFAGLGMMSAAKEINRQKRSKLRGRRSRTRHRPRLDPANLLHRANEHRDNVIGHFNKARRISLIIDAAEHQTQIDALMETYTEAIQCLIDLNAHKAIEDLIRREQARGVIRALVTYRRLT